MAKKEQTCWMWQRKDGTLATYTANATQRDCRALWSGDRDVGDGHPVRVRITPIAGKKKGTVKRGK